MSYKPEIVIPPFLSKTFELVSDPLTDSIIRWCDDGKAFEILSEEQMVPLLAANFKHNKMASFVRQLNVYDFHKVKSVGSLKFANNYFQEGQPQLLKLLSRKDTQRKELRLPPPIFPPSEDVHVQVGELKAAREEDFRVLAELRTQQENMQNTVNVVIQQNRKLVEELALSRREAVEMQRTLQIIMNILADESAEREPALSIDPNILAMVLCDDTDLQPPCKRKKLSHVSTKFASTVSSPKFSPSVLSPKFPGSPRSCDDAALFDMYSLESFVV